MLGNPNNPNNPNNRNKQGSGFTNLSRVIGANAQNQLGSAVGGGVSQQAQQAKQGIQQGLSSFGQQSDETKAKLEQDKQNAKRILTDPNAATEADVGAFRGIATGRYGGPQALENEQGIVNQAQQAQNLGKLAGTAGGRQSLLQRFVGGEGYNPGKQRLDTLLLGQTGSSQLRDAQRQSQTLAQQAQQAGQTARTQADYLSGQTLGLAQDVTGQATGQRATASTALDKVIGDYTTGEEGRQLLFSNIKKALAGSSRSGLSEQQMLDEVNAAMDTSVKNNIMSTADADKISTLYKTLKTPVQQLMRKKTLAGATGMFGYGAPDSESTEITPGSEIFSKLQLGDVLGDSLTTTQAENLNRAGVVSDHDRTKLNNLSRLLGQEQEFTSPADKFKAGTAAYDLNKAQRMSDEDIARLKGESIVDLPTDYLDIPIAEKLRRTFAPTGSESVEQASADVDKALSSDASLGSRLGAGYRTYGQMFSAPAGAILDYGLKTGNEINAGVNNIASLKPLEMAKGLTRIMASPYTGAFKVGRNVVKSIFCYASGTKIKMKNGSFKKIDSLKLEDDLYLGGKITAIGSSLEDDIYDYKGTEVTGSHSVFENGKFIRVQDSSISNKLNKKDVKVFPIECENHILVTNTHISSDFSETDDGHNIEPEARIVKLNSDSKKLKKLDKASTLLFGQNANKKI